MGILSFHPSDYLGTHFIIALPTISNVVRANGNEFSRGRCELSCLSRVLHSGDVDKDGFREAAGEGERSLDSNPEPAPPPSLSAKSTLVLGTRPAQHPHIPVPGLHIASVFPSQQDCSVLGGVCFLIN